MTPERERQAAAERGITVEEVREFNRRFLAKIREGMRLAGYEDVPETDEALEIAMHREDVWGLIREIIAESKGT